MRTSKNFEIQKGIPFDITEGNIIEIGRERHKVVKIKSVKFLDMRTIQISGLSMKI